MANHACALDFHLNEKRVAITIGQGRDGLQPVTRGLALGPQLIAPAAVKGYIPGRNGLLPSLTIHKTKHEDFSAAVILDDGRHKPCHFLEVHLDHFSSSFIDRRVSLLSS